MSIDLEAFASQSLENLESVFSKLDTITGHLVVLERTLSRKINFLTPFSKLKQRCKINKVVWLSDTRSNVEYENWLKQHDSVVFATEQCVKSIDQVCDIVSSKLFPIISAGSGPHALALIVTGSSCKTADLILETRNVKGDIALHSWALSPFKLADDLISLELFAGGLREIYCYNSSAALGDLSESLLNLVVASNYQLRFTSQYSLGDNSSQFIQFFKRQWKNHLSTLSPEQRKTLDDVDDALFMDRHSFANKQCDLVVLERSTDFVSLLLSQLSYPGICDDLRGIDMNNIEIFDTMEDIPTETTFQIENPDDELYHALRDVNFSLVGPVLNSFAKDLQMQMDSRRDANEISEIRQFVSKLGDLTSSQNYLKMHTLLAESIMDQVKSGGESEEDNYFHRFIALQQDILSDNFDNKANCSEICNFMWEFTPPITDTVRLLVLTSIVKRGIRDAQYQTLKKEVIESYGIKYLPLFNKLRDLKLCYIRESQDFPFLPNTRSLFDNASVESYSESMHKAQLIKDFANVAFSLNLMPAYEKNDVSTPPPQPDFAFPGYVPVVARLVQCIYDRTFIENNPSLRRGAEGEKHNWDGFEFMSTYFDGYLSEKSLVPEEKRKLFNTVSGEKKEECIVVVMIGGITYGEMATLRHVVKKINKQLGLMKKLVVLTTGMTKSADVLKLV